MTVTDQCQLLGSTKNRIQYTTTTTSTLFFVTPVFACVNSQTTIKRGESDLPFAQLYY